MFLGKIAPFLSIKKSPLTAIPCWAAAAVSATTAAVLPIAIKTTEDAFHYTDTISIPGLAIGTGGAVISAGLANLFVRCILDDEDDFFGFDFGKIVAAGAFMATPIVGSLSAAALYLSSRLFADNHVQGAWEMLQNILG